jgi:hypothetical protein
MGTSRDAFFFVVVILLFALFFLFFFFWWGCSKPVFVFAVIYCRKTPKRVIDHRHLKQSSTSTIASAIQRRARTIASAAVVVPILIEGFRLSMRRHDNRSGHRSRPCLRQCIAAYHCTTS